MFSRSLISAGGSTKFVVHKNNNVVWSAHFIGICICYDETTSLKLSKKNTSAGSNILKTIKNTSVHRKDARKRKTWIQILFESLRRGDRNFPKWIKFVYLHRQNFCTLLRCKFIRNIGWNCCAVWWKKLVKWIFDTTGKSHT